MGNTFFFPWEIGVMQWLQSFESGFTTALAKMFTMLGDEYLMILIIGLLYWCINKELARKLSLVVLSAAMLGSLLKGLFLRRRPYMDNSQVKCIRAAHPDEDIMLPTAQGYSLPSLHATMSASLYGGLAGYVRKKWTAILAVFLPLMIGLSRPYLGVHYPTDVLCGWALGVVSIFAMGSLADNRGYRFAYILTLAVGALGFIYCRDNEFFSLYGVIFGMLLGFMYEEKHVNFKPSEKWWSYVVRPLLGVVIFAVLNVILKLPVKGIDAQEHEAFALIYRLLRYGLSTFCIIGLYPKIFKRI